MAENEAQVKCGIGDCGKEFPKDLSEIHFEQNHAAALKDEAMAKIKPTSPSTKKVNLVEPEVKTGATTAGDTVEAKTSNSDTTNTKKDKK